MTTFGLGKVMASRKFVLEYVDQITNCITGESIFAVDDVTALCEIVDPAAVDIHPAAYYELELKDIEKIKLRFEIAGNDYSPVAQLRSWHVMDELPYKVHTNRELALMLAGEKPFAAFSEYLPSDLDDECIPESCFAPYVQDGLFLKREYVIAAQNNRKTRVVLYARSGEEWRIEAYILLKRTAEKAGWSEGFERMEGALLGYAEWQNDIYIEKFFKSSGK